MTALVVVGSPRGLEAGPKLELERGAGVGWRLADAARSHASCCGVPRCAGLTVPAPGIRGPSATAEVLTVPGGDRPRRELHSARRLNLCERESRTGGVRPCSRAAIATTAPIPRAAAPKTPKPLQ